MTPVFLSKADLDVALRDADAARKQEQSEMYTRTAKKHREEYDVAKKEVLSIQALSFNSWIACGECIKHYGHESY